MNAEVLAVVAYDSKAGGSHSAIVALGAGDVVFGVEGTRLWKDWSVHETPIGLGGGSQSLSSASNKFPKLKPGKFEEGGLAQIEGGRFNVGAYAGAGGGGRSGGVGGYVTLSGVGCKP